MDPRLVCQIFVRNASGEGISRGTGYPITHDRVLTARHVVAPPDASPVSIEVIFEYEESDGSGKPQAIILKYTATSVTCGAAAEQADVAVLDVKLPDSLQPSHLLLHEPPLVDTRVRGQGFPKLTKNQKKGKKDGFRGRLRTFTKAETYVPFDVENSPQDKTQWCGASGSAVFDNNVPSRMFGVLTAGRDGKVQSQLCIVPLPGLLEQPEFLEAIRYDVEYQPRANHRDTVLKCVGECIEEWRASDAASFAAFESKLRSLAGRQSCSTTDFELIHFMIDQCPVDALLVAMVELAGAHVTARMQLRELSEFIVPLNYAVDRVNELRRSFSQKRSCFLENAVVEKSVSAVIMSGFDAKPVDGKEEGMIDYQKPPSQGLVPTANVQERQVISFFQQFFALFAVPFPDSLRHTAVDQDVAALLNGDEGRNLRARLKTRKTRLNGRTAWCVVKLDNHPVVQGIEKSVIARVSSEINRDEALLVFIECRDRRDESAEAERNLLSNCQYLLSFED